MQVNSSVRYLILILFCGVFIKCSSPDLVDSASHKSEVFVRRNTYSNPALIDGSSFGHYFQSLCRLGLYSDMLKFTESGTVKKFGRDQLLLYFKTKLKFDYELGKLTNIFNTGDTIMLTYSQSHIDATKRLIRIALLVENDSCKLLLHNLNDNPFY